MNLMFLIGLLMTVFVTIPIVGMFIYIKKKY
ncbi:hypothetical protein J2Z83_003740 [Virgibacillus natechei]|uniref:Uncharacterized protein n=1 Tax=Virgibacillus natechei TaxID=1216297 RepID=A0ABS4INK2_9BACI|nr:hypothetical protein [Virgibacillus natechei]